MNLLPQEKINYDVLVVGGGHSGCEAALASARLGFCTLLITSSIDTIATLSCNPSIGGVGKSHLVKEIDALGGEMAKVADSTAIHFKILNSSRGFAVRGTRTQNDMDLYKRTMINVILNTDGLFLRQDNVNSLVLNNHKKVIGVKTKYSGLIKCKKVILTTGTFMNSFIHLGDKISQNGRYSESSDSELSFFLKKIGFNLGRLKTGTCPRLDSRTINFGSCKEEISEENKTYFSFNGSKNNIKQISCWMTYTNKNTHEIIKNAINLGLSPIYNGQINGIGPRYCPSIEDKIIKFGSRDSHHVFLEPQGLNTYEVYPSGLSSSLPAKIQEKFLRSIDGLNNVVITRWGYAVEYDFVDPTQCYPSLETKNIDGLYLAGQINGTTGYEEAAIQGLLAGLNASRSLTNKEPIILGRNEAYAGVLIDDLVTKGVSEPYRMFTSRAEYRLILREDNVYDRLSEIGFNAKLLSKDKFKLILQFEENVKNKIKLLRSININPDASVLNILRDAKSSMINNPISLYKLLKRPEITISELLLFKQVKSLNLNDNLNETNRAIIEIKYEGYVKRNKININKEKVLDKIIIPKYIFEIQIPGLSNEIFEKLKIIMPKTLSQASRIKGMTPVGLELILIAIKRGLKKC